MNETEPIASLDDPSEVRKFLLALAYFLPALAMCGGGAFVWVSHASETRLEEALARCSDESNCVERTHAAHDFCFDSTYEFPFDGERFVPQDRGRRAYHWCVQSHVRDSPAQP